MRILHYGHSVIYQVFSRLGRSSKTIKLHGAQLVVATTEGGAICGGYNPAGWIGLGDDRDSLSAFLFTWPDGDTSLPPVKLRKVLALFGRQALLLQ